MEATEAQNDFDRLALEPSPGIGSSAKVVKRLVGESIRSRRSIRPRGSVAAVAEARVARERPLVALLRRVKSAQQGEVLHALAEWGGPQVADAIGEALLERSGWNSVVLREQAIQALETLGGPRAVVSLAKVAQRARGRAEAHAALDALEAIASARSAEVDEGGVMPESREALEFWTKHREELRTQPLGAAIAVLESLERDAEIAPRVRAVRGSLVTAARQEFEAGDLAKPFETVALRMASFRRETEPSR